MLPGDEQDDLLPEFLLDPDVVHLNHGSFGACPAEVLDLQTELRNRLERNAIQFFGRELEVFLDETRGVLGAFLGARPEDLALVPNATTAVNAVLRSIRFDPGDEILTTSHGYNACQNAAEFVAERAGARVVVADVPFPVTSPDQVTEAILACVTPRTRLALVDHVTSQTALVWPIADVIERLRDRGVDVLVDGAHAPGMVELDLKALGAAYYTGNCHKWVCAPKGAAFLHVRADKQMEVRPTTISHGANSQRRTRSRFLVEFDWTGTTDPSALLCIPAALGFLERSWPGGIAAMRVRNRALALRARAALLELTGGAALAPEGMIGSIASVELPPTGALPESKSDLDPLSSALARGAFGSKKIEVPVFVFGAQPKRLLRVSAHVYNRWPDYEALLTVLPRALEADRVEARATP